MYSVCALQPNPIRATRRETKRKRLEKTFLLCVCSFHRIVIGQIELSFALFPIQSSRNVMETNYKIIGGDGREYGPVTLDEIKGWIRDGRIGRTTQIWRSDLGSWLPAAQYQELQLEIAPIVGAAGELHSALEAVGFWPRVGAHILDQLILSAVGYILFGAPPSNVTTFPEVIQILGARIGYSVLISTLYHVGMNGSIGATLGKLVIGARIVNVDGSKIGYLKAFLRMLAEFVNVFTLGIGYLMVAFREDKRGLHDLIVGTRVVYKR